jgi:hypothetical protein
MSDTTSPVKGGAITYSRLDYSDGQLPAYEYDSPGIEPQTPAASQSLSQNDASDASDEKGPPLPRVHWRVPTTMAASLLMGVVLAMTQHFVFNYLDNRPVKNHVQQVWMGRIGTGLAFATQTFLTTATGIAYIQLLIISVSQSLISRLCMS